MRFYNFQNKTQKHILNNIVTSFEFLWDFMLNIYTHKRVINLYIYGVVVLLMNGSVVVGAMAR